MDVTIDERSEVRTFEASSPGPKVRTWRGRTRTHEISWNKAENQLKKMILCIAFGVKELSMLKYGYTLLLQ